MKRLLAVLLIITGMTVGLSSCAGQLDEAQPTSTQAASKEPEKEMVALLLDGKTDFNEALSEHIQPLMEQEGFRLERTYSAHAEKQVDDMYRAIGNGAVCIAVLPFDMDNLQQVTQECDVQGIPVINVMVPINGVVATLLSPDYQKMGTLAAKAIHKERPEGAHVLTVENKRSPFVMQLLHDGFLQEAKDNATNIQMQTTVLAAPQEEDVFDQVLEALENYESIDAIFSQDEAFTFDIARAVAESERDATIVAVGGGHSTVELVEGGNVQASIFVSAIELAELTASSMLQVINEQKVSEYVPVAMEQLTRDTLDKFATDGLYAEPRSRADKTATQSPKKIPAAKGKQSSQESETDQEPT